MKILEKSFTLEGLRRLLTGGIYSDLNGCSKEGGGGVLVRKRSTRCVQGQETASWKKSKRPHGLRNNRIKKFIVIARSK